MRFSIRDLLWLILVAAVIVAWRVELQAAFEKRDRQLRALKVMVVTLESKLADSEADFKTERDLRLMGRAEVRKRPSPVTDPETVRVPE
jgi:hypothetical protein